MGKVEEHKDYLDSLKGIAIIGVTLVHTGGAGLPGRLGQIGSAGARGVEMFFVISGLLNFFSAEAYFGNPQNVNIFNVWKW